MWSVIMLWGDMANVVGQHGQCGGPTWHGMSLVVGYRGRVVGMTWGGNSGDLKRSVFFGDISINLVL